MTVDEITTIISNTGFPIAMVAVLCYYIYVINGKTQEQMVEMKSAVEALKDAIALLTSKLGGD